jgi:hypothetical protein
MAPPPGREAPPVYRPHAAAVSQLKSKPAAPPVYRPQAAVSQLKLKPAAPPVYRPQAAVSQLKPAAPPVYRPQPTVSQPKFAGAMTAANARTPVPPSWNGAPKFEPAAPCSTGKMVLPALAHPALSHPALRTNAIQRMQDSESDSDSGSGDDYTEEEKKKQLRFNFLAGTPQTVIENTAHQVAHFDTGRFTAVWTCPNCQRMLAYTDLAGTFHLSEYGYMSVNENEHRQRALELDHHPPWAPRLASLERRGASRAEMREDYQDEGRLRALCRVCNGKHNLEGKQVKNYDSDDDDFNPQRTPKHETQYNTGQFSGYRPDDYFG